MIYICNGFILYFLLLTFNTYMKKTQKVIDLIKLTEDKQLSSDELVRFISELESLCDTVTEAEVKEEYRLEQLADTQDERYPEQPVYID
jgi:hypothetical protein